MEQGRDNRNNNQLPKRRLNRANTWWASGRSWAMRNKRLAMVIVLLTVLLLLGLIVWNVANRSVVTRRATSNEVLAGYEKQLPELKKNIERNGDDAEAHKNYAVALYATGDTQKAKEQYEAAVKLNGQDAAAYNNLGNVQRDLKEYDASIASYKKSIELSPKSLNPYINLANVQLYMKNQPNDAIAIYKQGLTVFPDNPQLQSLLAVAYERQGNKDEAKGIYEKMLKVDPNSQVAKAGLERLK